LSSSIKIDETYGLLNGIIIKPYYQTSDLGGANIENSYHGT
jgi:hypothetical protein